MRSVKPRVPALAAEALTLVTAALTATPTAIAAPAPAGRAAAAATAWRIQPTPNPKTDKQGRLNAVSCSSPGACTAVGVFDNLPGTGTLVERWNGTSWSIQASANPAGALTSVLFGVSCPAATFCVAVGNYQNRAGRHAIMAEAWNGSSWSVMSAPPPAGARRSFLNGVSCTSATACTAVGSYQTRSGKHVTLAERWNGTTWSRQPTPNPATPPRSALAAVSCTSASACTAVGSSAVDNFRSNSVTLAERWNGTIWSIQSTPNGPFGGFLTGVSCRSAAACIAVGGDNNSSPLVEAWNGTSWSIPPTPDTGGAQLNSVSCASPSACTAVGSGAFAERWNGTAWSIQPIPDIHDNAALTGVSCATTSACTAVGFDLEATLGEAWDGTSWSAVPTVTPPSLFGTHRLTSVSCTSPSACMAVGVAPRGLATRTLAERWDGTRWTIVPTPSRGDAELRGVSCTSPSACIAVGRSFPEGVLSERWDGTRWSLLTTPNPRHLGDLFSVSCTSASACIAVGGADNDRIALAEVWNGTSWKIQPTPSTVRADVAVLLGVSCTSPSACTAVGAFARFGGRQVSLAERWDGTSWSIQPTPNPPGTHSIIDLNGVSCTSGSACTAVGGFVTSSPFTAGTLAEAWDGTSWSIQPTPAQPSQDLLSFDGVSCTSASACIAVGAAADTLAEVWNGTAWSIDPTPPSPPSLEGIGGHLNGVWCTSAASCTAVGDYYNSAGNLLTLAQARS
jgi:hypothetical protein